MHHLLLNVLYHLFKDYFLNQQEIMPLLFLFTLICFIFQ